jgi:ParB-like chromosome segregation protein Spo0J
MNDREMRLEQIDFSDETFRISEDLEPASLQASLREVGQLNPVILRENAASRPAIVCGWRRLTALRRLGENRCIARCLPREEGGPLSAFRIAIWDNLAQRQFDALEKARILFTLEHACAVEETILVDRYLPLLGLASHKNVLQSYLRLHLLSADLRRHLIEGRLTVASAEHLAGQNRKAQDAMASLFDRSRFSASLQRQVLDLVDDLAAIGECGAEEIVGSPEIRAALSDPGLTPFQRGEAVCRILHRRRNPRLSQAEERFQAEKGKLDLPGSVRLTPDPFFEKPRIRVEFDSPTAASFREIADALHRAARSPGIDGLFRVKQRVS